MQSHEPAEDSASTITPGTILDGRFRIEGLIGQGGMGYVLAAMHLELQQRVAIKLLSPGREQKSQSATRLAREARASARIHSEHVVRVLDVVQSQGAPPYIVLEYLVGEDLARCLSQRGRLETAEAVDIVLQACEAIGEGHRLGIVHRDLKPSNLFLCSRGANVKVLDFGISKMDEAGASLTQSHALLGSPLYAAPEQLRSSHEVDARADIWSLGVVLFECVTGKRPFAGQTLAQVCTSILHDGPRSPRALNPQLPSALEAVLLRCLSKEPAQRYQSIEELVRALHPFAPRAAERCASYLDTLPPAVVERNSRPIVRQPARAESSDTLTGSAEYDSHDRSASLIQPSSHPRRGVKRAVVFAALSLAALIAWQLLRTVERRAAANSATEPTPNGMPSGTELSRPSASSPARPSESLPPPAPPSASAKQVDAAPPRLSNRTSGPRPQPSHSAHRAIAPWVDTR